MSNYYNLLIDGVEVSIDIDETGTSPNYVILKAGIASVSENLNEVVESNQFLAGEGFGESEVTGMAPVIELSGKRVVGDPAQDWIFNKKFALGCKRKTTMRVRVLNMCDGETIILSYSVPVTITGLQELSGNSAASSDITISLAFRGKPSPMAQTPEFTVIGNGTASVSVEIKSDTDGAGIYYTDDGTTPTAQSTAYSGILTFTTAGTKTLKAIAIKDGLANSGIATTTIVVS